MENKPFQMKIETREAGGLTISGYVNAVGRDSIPLPSPRGPFVEQIVPGTFKTALENASNVALKFNHDRILGSTEDVLTLKEDNIGLWAEAHITDPEIIEKAQKGELRGWSFSFVNQQSQWEATGGPPRRKVQGLQLKEVSLLDKLPAYPGTSIELREETPNEYRYPWAEEAHKPFYKDRLTAEIEILRLKGEF